MNAATKTLFTALIAVAGAAAIGMGLADGLAPQTASQVVKLERVVVTGKRMAPEAVAQLPRVVVHGHRSDAGLQLMADAGSTICQPAQVC